MCAGVGGGRRTHRESIIIIIKNRERERERYDMVIWGWDGVVVAVYYPLSHVSPASAASGCGPTPPHGCPMAPRGAYPLPPATATIS